MDCITRVGLVTVLGLGLLAGCGKSGSSNGAASSGGAAAGQIDVANNPMAKAASDFLDAILKGDTQRASARLNAAGDATHRRQRQAILPARVGIRDLQNRSSRYQLRRSSHRAVCADRQLGGDTA